MNKEELQLLIRDLYEENRMLRELVDMLEEQQKNMKVSLSLEETIQAFREMNEEEKKKQDKAIKNGRFDKKLLLVETRE